MFDSFCIVLVCLCEAVAFNINSYDSYTTCGRCGWSPREGKNKVCRPCILFLRKIDMFSSVLCWGTTSVTLRQRT